MDSQGKQRTSERRSQFLQSKSLTAYRSEHMLQYTLCSRMHEYTERGDVRSAKRRKLGNDSVIARAPSLPQNTFRESAECSSSFGNDNWLTQSASIHFYHNVQQTTVGGQSVLDRRWQGPNPSAATEKTTTTVESYQHLPSHDPIERHNHTLIELQHDVVQENATLAHQAAEANKEHTRAAQEVHVVDSQDEQGSYGHTVPAAIGEEVVCYGMLTGIEVESRDTSYTFSERLPAHWNGVPYLQNAYTGHDIAKLSKHIYQLLTTLAEYAGAEFQFWLEERQPLAVEHGESLHNDTSTGRVLLLSIIMYGPLATADAIGEWLSYADMYLQLPDTCDRDVRYKNPHCLSCEDESPLMTSSLGRTSFQSHASKEELCHETFAELYTDEVYGEAQQPQIISSILHSHQRTALTFMLERENGWNFDGQRNDIWKSHVDSFGITRYKNALTGRIQTRPPTAFRGGILADEMGLGKTCTILSLIAADLSSNMEAELPCFVPQNTLKGTLIVVPFSLLQVWEKQIRQHFRPGSIKWKIFHRVTRQYDFADLSSYDIIVTTYNTVASEWKKHKSSRARTCRNQLFSALWHRIILDEAHVIRNRQTANSKSVCAIQAERRWCMTGTPIQNRLGDIFSLVRFLGVEPYTRFKEFEDDILRPWRLRNDEVAFKRLQSLMKAIAIRRPRAIISLPERHEILEYVYFSPGERQIYESAREGAAKVVESAISEQHTNGSAYINALQKINDMRYICNHGVKPSRNRNCLEFDIRKEATTLKSLLDSLMESNGVVCVQCGTDMQDEDEGEQQLLEPSTLYVQETSPRQICKQCAQQMKETTSTLSSSASPFNTENTPSQSPAEIQHSSKVQALMTYLRQVPMNEKSAVFSYWTSTLATVAQALCEAGISFIQYDGRLSRTKRDQALHDFATDCSVRVILVSITCGGQGLDLTAANHAFLLEPQWNPMLEEQAMSRVHRLGQTKAVRLVRFVVKGTWEQNIRVLQERKRSLADLIVDRRNLKDGDDGKKQLYFLRELVA
jgi:SWI/SNF-related matrix-associated actin-dependent regulator of chromatin subfamily A3